MENVSAAIKESNNYFALINGVRQNLYSNYENKKGYFSAAVNFTGLHCPSKNNRYKFIVKKNAVRGWQGILFSKQNQIINMRQLFLVALLGFSFASCKKDAATIATAKDINTAAKVSVDRFSSSAGHLFVRTATNGLPAANAAINMDLAPFITNGLAAGGAHTTYYNLDIQSSTPVDIYVFFKSDGITQVTGQNNVIPTKPGDAGYSDFWRVNKVVVPDSYVPNSLTSETAISLSGYAVTKTTTIVNCPVVPFGSTAALQFGGGSQALTFGWYKDSAVAYFNFAEKALTVPLNGKLATPAIYVMFNDNNAGPSSGFKTESGTTQVHNVISLSPADAGYSPLWNVVVINNTYFNMQTNLATALLGPVLNPNAGLVNCPVVN